MHLSPHAKSLLEAGDILGLQALSYEALLPKTVQDEILASFLNPSRAVFAGDSITQGVKNSTSYHTLSDACVISSGQIFSKSTLEVYIAAHPGRGITCPITCQALTLDIGSTGLPYVLLPKIDEVIRGFKTLCLPPRTEVRRHSDVPQRASESTEMSVSMMYSALPAFHSPAVLFKNSPAASSAPPLAVAPALPVGTFELKVARNKLRMVVEFARSPENAFADQLEHYFKAMLPDSQVDITCRSYSMSQESFGRCWKKLNDQRFEVDLWFPPHETTLKKRTFSDHHLARLLALFSENLHLPEEAAVAEAVIPACVISEIAPRTYVVALPATAVTFEQLMTCCQTFLDSTKRTAEKLHHNIVDHVMTHDHTVAVSTTSGLGIFGGGQAGAQVSSSAPSVPCGRK